MNCRCTKWSLGLALGTAASFASAQAQPITIADLDGLSIESVLTREQVNRFSGRQVTVTVDNSWSVQIGPIPNVTSTSKAQIRGRPDVEPLTGKFRINESRQVGSFGGGEAQWTLDDGTLTFTRNFKQGAYRLRITLARKDDGFECTATQTFARENGTGEVVFWGPAVQADVTIVDWRQLSSTCRVYRR